MARTDHVADRAFGTGGRCHRPRRPVPSQEPVYRRPTIGSEAHHVHLARLQPTRGRRPRRGARARTRDPDPRRRSGVGPTRAARSPRRPQGRGVLRPAPPPHARGNGERPGRRDASVRGAEPGRRVGRLDHPHRWRRMARPRRTAAVDLRRHVPARVASPSSPGCSTRPEPQSRWRAATRSTAGGRSRAAASTPTGSTETASTRRAANRNSGSRSSGPTRSRSRTRGPSWAFAAPAATTSTVTMSSSPRSEP